MEEEKIDWNCCVAVVLITLITSIAIAFSNVRSFSRGYEKGWDRGATVALDTMQKIVHDQARRGESPAGKDTCTRIVFRDTVSYILTNKTLKR